MLTLDAKIPGGPIQDAWTNHKNRLRLVGPRNRPKYKVLVIGSGLAGAAAAASMGAMGYQVECFCFQDSPRRAHSIAAQGGINASKNYRNDGDSTWRLFFDTQKGGDYRAREQNVYRLAELSTAIIDQAVAQGVPFAREYGGKLANRSFGGVLVERTFYCRGETGQQLLLGAYSALEEQVAKKTVKMHTRSEMLDLVVFEGRAGESWFAISKRAKSSRTLPMRWFWPAAATETCIICRPMPRAATLRQFTGLTNEEPGLPIRVSRKSIQLRFQPPATINPS